MPTVWFSNGSHGIACGQYLWLTQLQPKPLRFTRGSRKHRIGRASTRYVIAAIPATETEDPETGDRMFTWIGPDERDRELEIAALDKPDCLFVIHVMPTQLRRKAR